VIDKVIPWTARYRTISKPLLWQNGRVTNEPTSEQLRREAENLRETATDLMEHAALLILRSVELGEADTGPQHFKAREEVVKKLFASKEKG
jgi:hypothetical protein